MTTASKKTMIIGWTLRISEAYTTKLIIADRKLLNWSMRTANELLVVASSIKFFIRGSSMQLKGRFVIDEPRVFFIWSEIFSCCFLLNIHAVFFILHLSMPPIPKEWHYFSVLILFRINIVLRLLSEHIRILTVELHKFFMSSAFDDFGRIQKQTHVKSVHLCVCKNKSNWVGTQYTVARFRIAEIIGLYSKTYYGKSISYNNTVVKTKFHIFQ